MFCEKINSIIRRRVRESSKFLGVLVLMLSTVLASISGLLCKMSSLNGVEVSWAMGVIGTCLSIGAVCLFQDQKLDVLLTKPYLKSLANGIVLRGVATYVYFLSLDYISATDALVIVLFVSIVWSTILEAIRLGIRPHWLAIISAIVGLVGMVLMCKPDGFVTMQVDLTYLKGIALAAAAGCIGSSYFVYVNKLSTVPPLWHWVSYPIGLLFLTKPEISINKFQLSACSGFDRGLALLAVVFQLFGGLTAIIGTQLTLASVSFVVKLFGIVLTFVLQIILIPAPIALNSVIGGVFIVIAMVLQFVVLSLKSHNKVTEKSLTKKDGSIDSKIVNMELVTDQNV